MEADLVTLRSFIVLAEEGHFGRAAARLYVTQPTLTRRISALEKKLGTSLLVRSPHGAFLTPAGQKLHARLPRVIADLADVLHDVAEPDARELTVAALGPAVSEHTSAIVQAIAHEPPGLRVNFRSCGYLEHLRCLTSREVDVAFLWLGAYDDRELAGLDIVLSRTEPRSVLLPVAHPLAAATSVPVASVLHECFVDDVAGMSSAWRAYWMLDEARGAPARVHSLAPRNAEEKLRQIMAGHGITVMPSSVARHYERPGLTAVELDDAAPAVLGVGRRVSDPRTHVATAARVLAEITRHAGCVGTPTREG